MKNRNITITTLFLTVGWLALCQQAQGVVPAPDGGYPGGNTAEGQNALLNLTTGGFNTAVGFLSLRSNTDGQFNTGVGAGTLLANTGQANTAIGAGALLFNTTGVKNTATGAFALFNNIDGDSNTASGEGALFNNNAGFSNTAVGYNALLSNTTAGDNTGIGTTALFSNSTGEFNTAIGSQALRNNVDGDSNTAIGDSAGFNITGSGNVCIGAGVNGFAGENNITRIRNVYETVATDRAVYVTADGRIGTLSSSRRYKDEITPMAKASEAIHSLRPMTFRYKTHIDATRCLSFGLIAEDVADIDPNLVTRDREGKPQTVRYEAVNAMLLNEFLKEHCKVQELEATVAQQQKNFQSKLAEQEKRLELLSSDLRRVSAQIEVSKAAPQVAANKP